MAATSRRAHLAPMKAVCMLDQTVYEFDPRVRRKAEALAAAGYTVDVLTLRLPDEDTASTERTLTVNGVNVTTIPLAKKRGSWGRYAFEYVTFFLWAFVRVAQRMLRRKYAAIEVNTLPDFLIFAPMIAKWMGAKLVLDMHEITPEFCISKYGITEKSWFTRFLKFIERISFNFADHVITISDPIRDLLVSRGLRPSKSTVIVNAADETVFLSVPHSSDSTDTAAPPGQFVMMYHGTLTRTYGLATAVRAFAQVQAQMPEAQLWILGYGPEAESLSHLIHDLGLSSKIKMLGYVPMAEVPAWLRKCDVGILPMRRDIFLEFAFPNKLAEYIIMGKAVIISRLKGLRYYFSENALAYFEPDSPTDLSAQMLRLYSNPELRARLAERAMEEYAPIRWDVMKRRYLKLMEDLIGPACNAIGELTAVQTAALVHSGGSRGPRLSR